MTTTTGTRANTKNPSKVASFGEEGTDDDDDDAADHETPHRAGNGDETGAQLIINKAAILNEIARLGGDMVSRIEVLKP